MHHRRDRGFSLIIVFFLVTVMVGVAGAVLLSTQEDLSVAGGDREQLIAFYTAEYALAQGRAYLSQQATPYVNSWSSPSSYQWSAVLNALAAPANLNGCDGTVAAPTPRMAWQDFMAPGNNTPAPFPAGAPMVARWKFCAHNNADDPAFIDVNGNTAAPPTGCGTGDPLHQVFDGTGNTCDARDPGSIIVVEGWGAYPVDPASGKPLPGAAVAHLSINLGKPVPSNVASTSGDGYSQEGVGGSHTGNAGSLETAKIDLTVVR